jgi:hypothetical protein
MYARPLASWCLLCVSVSTGWSESAPPATSELEVHLKGDDASSPDVLWEMQHELSLLMQNAGFRLVWRGSGDPPSSGGAAHLVIVELRGPCSVLAGSRDAPLPASLVLASSAVVDGKVLPFSRVDCVALNRFLAPVISENTEAQRCYLYGRSMARLLAHEFFHVLAQTEAHTSSGIAKARFSTADLLADHFDFEPVAILRMRPPSPETSAVDALVAAR